MAHLEEDKMIVEQQSAAREMEPEPRRIEPIFDASGTLRRVSREPADPRPAELQSGRNSGHPAR